MQQRASKIVRGHDAVRVSHRCDKRFAQQDATARSDGAQGRHVALLRTDQAPRRQRQCACSV